MSAPSKERLARLGNIVKKLFPKVMQAIFKECVSPKSLEGGIFTRESMKSFKSLDAHIFYLSGWVKLVQSYIPEQSNHVILTADVTPSMRVNEAPHHPWIALTKDGSVAVAHCDCMAGLSESCSHIGALLFKIEAAVKLGYTKTACTEEPCKWNADFVKKVVPATISKINFYKAARVKKAKETKRRKVKKFAASSIDQQQELLSALYSCSTRPVALSTFDGVSDKFFWTRPAPTIAKMPLPLNSLYSSDNQNLTIDDLLSKCKGICDRMTISDNDTTYIYDCTKTQSSSMTWYEQRIGRVSSSTIHRIYKTSLEKPSKSLLLQICNPSTTDLKVPSIVWGREHEKQAILEFKETLSTMHQDFTVTDSGFLIDTVHPFIGVSADSIANCTCHGKSVVEVKCPYKHRDSTYEEYIANSTCCIYDRNKLDTSHPYYSQVQLQMYVHDTEFCSFVVWGKHFL
ncbi:unnamed protein product [Mytilus coruscus]|uniref:YqaJ viral recombinase domain-containing protein n=1 Tax=Mytilus coruscus TaxID=42192 RepID=A0A6J8AIY7_MYTCO|nr:unnamed protein product [Mytilus coruscus]